MSLSIVIRKIPKSVSNNTRKLKRIRHVALDLDGTIYRGTTVFKTTLPFLELLKSLGLGYTFLTNNPSKSNADYRAKLRRMGIPAKPDQIYTSAQATIEYLQKKWPRLKRLFVLGTPSMCGSFTAAGYALVLENPDERPDAVVVGFDTTLTYPRLCRAAWWITRGVPYFATNPDAVCPTDEPTVLVDCGSITAALEKATGRAPVAVLGKPDVAMLRGILQRHRLRPGQLAMVGDRTYTDMEMARRAGALGVLVLTGETPACQAVAVKPSLDMIVPSLAELGRELLLAREARRK